jgi:hypothetical protein
MKEGTEPGPTHTAPLLCAMFMYFLSRGSLFLGGQEKILPERSWFLFPEKNGYFLIFSGDCQSLAIGMNSASLNGMHPRRFM